ncbi:kinase-like domain-containing protein [Chytridium lagenaria]|nr:kinase-like domain-containing protein [Chytridium lagenaria]
MDLAYAETEPPEAGTLHGTVAQLSHDPDRVEDMVSSNVVLLTPTAVVNGQDKVAVQKHKFMGNYEILKTVGEGSFARVKLAIHRLTNQKVALKVIDKERLPDEYSLKNIHREAQIMRMLDHPNIIQLYEVMETKKELFLVLEYASGGEVLDYIVAHGRLKEKEARKFIGQIVSALEYCHNLNIAHRDLKSENLLLDTDMSIKISDFGLSNIFEQGKTLGTCCGSPVYSAPELIEGKRYVGPKWTHDLPFANSNLTALYESILKGKYDVPDFLSPAQVKEHPWMTMSGKLDKDILEHLEQMGFEMEAAIVSVLQGKFNQAAGTYLLFKIQAEKIAASASIAAAPSSSGSHSAGQGAMEELEVMNRKIAEDRERMNDGTTSEALAKMMIEWERNKVTSVASPTGGSPKASRAVLNGPSLKEKQGKGREQKRCPSQMTTTPAVLPPPMPAAKALPHPSFHQLPTPQAKLMVLKSTHTAMLDIASASSGNVVTNSTATKPPPQKIARKRSHSTTATGQEENLYLDPLQDIDSDGHPMQESTYAGIRTIRFAFNLQTTTNISPDIILDRLKRVLGVNDVAFVAEGFLMEFEVCKLPRLKRFSGDLWDYKRLCSKIIVEMDLGSKDGDEVRFS